MKKRILVAAGCFAAVVLLLFVYTLLVRSDAKTMTVAVISSPVQKGTVIEAAQVTEKEIGALNMPADLIASAKDAVGQYALADFAPGDMILSSKIAPALPGAEEKLLTMDGTRIAVSVTLKTFASGVSNKIAPGDIVSCLVTTDEGTSIPPELTYVEVLAATTATGIDKQRAEDTVEGNLETATLLVTPLQAVLLADADERSSLHLALVYRGNAVEQYLETQTALLQQVQEDITAKGADLNGDAVPHNGE